MKKRMTILGVLLSLTISLISQHSKVVVYSNTGQRMLLIINGEQYNPQPETNIQVTTLVGEWHKANILFENQNSPSITDYSLRARPNYETKYEVKKNRKGKWVMRWVSETELPAGYTPPPVVTERVVVVDQAAPPVRRSAPAQTTTTVETVTTTTSMEQADNDDEMELNIQGNVEGVNLGLRLKIGDMDGEVQTQSSTTVTTTSSSSSSTVTSGGGVYSESSYSETTTTTSGGGYVDTDPGQVVVVEERIVYVPGYGGPIGCPVPMSPADFNDAKSAVENKYMPDEKMAIAKQITRLNCFTVSQVKEMMSEFHMEDNRLSLAKYMYPYTYDQGNYYKLHELFYMPQSVESLNSAIGQ